MGISIQMTKAFFDSKGFRYDESDDGTVLSVAMGNLDNMPSLKILIIFDNDDNTVAIRAFNLCKVPEGKEEAMYQACSRLNAEYRWVKFCVNSNSQVSAEDDAWIQPDSCGEEIFELVMRMTGIVDQAYPTLMKVIWS